MYLTATILLIICLVYLELPGYFFIINPSVPPKYFYYLLAGMILPFILLRFKQFCYYLGSPFALWVFAEIGIYTLDLLNGNDAVIQRINDICQYLLVGLLLGFAVSITRSQSYQIIYPLLLIVLSMLVIFDFLNPGVLYPFETPGIVIGRGSATYINPTRAGEGIVLLLLLALPVTPMKYRMPLFLIAGLGVLSTFSRSSIMIWGFFGIFAMFTQKFPKHSVIFPLLILMILPLIFSSFTDYLDVRENQTGVDNILERLNFFQTQSLGDDSAQERLLVLKAGWRIFYDNPIFGAGTGATTFWSFPVNTHNEFAMVGAEHGIFGIAFWLWLIFILWRGNYFNDRGLQTIAAAMTFLMSFFSHTIISETYFLLSFAIISGQRKL